MKKKLAVILVLLSALTFFFGCEKGSNWKVTDHTVGATYTTVKLASGNYWAEYKVSYATSLQAAKTELIIRWKTGTYDYPIVPRVDAIYADGPNGTETLKSALQSMPEYYAVYSVTDQTNGKAGFEHKLVVKPAAFEYYYTINILIYLENKDGSTTQSDDKFNIKNMVETVKQYAQNKRIDLDQYKTQ